MYIPLNVAAYSPNTVNNGFPKQATKDEGRGFFTAPGRTTSGKLVRGVSSTFNDVWSQPRLFYNSLTKIEQQFLINAIRFETSHLTSDVIKKNVLIQLNRVSHDVAVRVASALGLQAPEADPTFYHDNKTADVGGYATGLKKLDGLKVAFLTSTNTSTSTSGFKSALSAENVDLVVVAESLGSNIDQTYSAADATSFDGIIVDGAVPSLFKPLAKSTAFPTGRPVEILLNGYKWGKPVGAIAGGSYNSTGSSVLDAAGIPAGDGVYVGSGDAAFSEQFLDGLKTFKFLDRFPTDD